MKRLLLLLFFSMLFARAVDAQTEMDRWLDKNVVPWHLEDGNTGFFDHLLKELDGNEILALGEATHGTHEFYRDKAELIKMLVAERDYRVVGFEFDGSAMEKINAYLHGGDGNLRSLMKGLYLYNADEILNLFEWLRAFNKEQSGEKRVTLLGFDNLVFHNDPIRRDEWMFETLREQLDSLDARKAILWAHNVHILKDTVAVGAKGLGYFLYREYEDAYYALAFDSYEGSVSTIGDGGVFESHDFRLAENTMSARLAGLGYDRLFLSFGNNPSPYDSAWSLLKINSVWNGDTLMEIQGGKDLNGILFIRKTTASKLLSDQ